MTDAHAASLSTEKAMPPLEVLKQFVSGEMSPAAFEDILYTDKALELLLSASPALPPYAEEHGLYLFLIACNYKSFGAVLNARGALSRFLKTCGIEVSPSRDMERRMTEKHRVLPKWLDISDETYSEIRQGAQGLEGEALLAFMKREIKARFVCLGKPPKWLQDAFWPMSNGMPMVFVGQLDISPLRHDTSYVYVFCGKDGKYLTLEQSA